jgi:calcium-translocating P-type ATPase
VAVTGIRGLTSAEAARRLAVDGPNVLPAPPRPAPWRHLLRQFVAFFALMLWVAAGLAFLAGLPQLGIAVIAVVVLNGVFAFVQEYRAERAAERLADLLPRRATVVRDGVRDDVDAAELVVGDLVLLEAGDRVSADLVADEAHALAIDTSTMTGESVPVDVDTGGVLHAGTFVVAGEASAVVTATGASTKLAGLAVLTRSGHRPRSPLTVELHRLVRVVAVMAVGVGVAFFALSLLIGTPAAEGMVFAIGVTVALVPEAMLPTVTLSLAMGAERLAQRDALVRRLESVETLGSVTFVCTDKTGTLTTNQMAVVRFWTPSGGGTISGPGYGPDAEVELSVERSVAQRLALAAARCSTGDVASVDGRWVPRGDTMEAALVALAHRVGVDLTTDRSDRPVLGRHPFDPRRRRMSVVVDGELLVKGAPDSVLPRCTTGAGDGAASALDDMASVGLRVLAIARRPWPPPGHGTAPDPGGRVVDPDDVESDLELLGLVGLQDPPRPGVADALAACRRAGIRVAMITGDHPATARTIAAQIGLLGPDDTVLTGAELPPDDAALGELVDRDGVVLSRIEPEDKLRVARALQARGHVVAMTGDGVNDGPALQEADIGIAMGRTGTDVAREASDLVLLREDFSVIVAAVEQGRATFANIRRFLTYHLTDNVAELFPFVAWALTGGRFPLMIGVLQVLALDIGTDTLPAVALGAEPPARHTLERPPVTGHLLNRTVARRAFGVLGPTEVVMSLLAFLATYWSAGWRPGDGFGFGPSVQFAASGAAFATIVVGQLTNAFACRSTVRPAWRIGWFRNRLLLAAVAIEAVVVALFLFVPPVADALEHGPPTALGWAVAAAACPAVLLADAADKWFRRRGSVVARRAGPPKHLQGA